MWFFIKVLLIEGVYDLLATSSEALPAGDVSVQRLRQVIPKFEDVDWLSFKHSIF